MIFFRVFFFTIGPVRPKKKNNFFFFFFLPKGKQKVFNFWPGAISIIEQQHDKTKNIISVPSKDSDQVGHSDFYSFEPMGPSDSLDPN